MPEPTKIKASDILAKLDELASAMRRQPAQRAEDDDIDPTDKRSLTGRLSTVTHQRTQAETRAAEAVQLAKELRETYEAQIAAIQADAAKSVTAAVRRVEQGYALRAAMVEPDDDGMQTAHRLYESLPENKRPDSIVEWWKGLTPEAAPKTLRAYLPAPAAVEAVEQVAATATVRQPPRVDVGRGKATDPDPGKMDAAQYDAWLEGMARQRDAERLG
jgi:hypothetical protein